MLKPKPVVLVQNDLPDFRYVLNKRKKSVKDVLETNQIKTIAEFNSWILANSHEYSFSEEFIAEAASFLISETTTQPVVVSVPEEVKVEETDVEESITENLPSHLSEEEETKELPELVEIPVKEKGHKKRNKSVQTV